MDRKQAEKELLKFNSEITKVQGYTKHGDDHMFLAYTGDLEEGRFLPFYLVNEKTGVISDFNPIDYEDSRQIIEALEG